MTNEYLVLYPSGKRFTIDGEFQLVDGQQHGLLPSVLSDDDVVFLDPRGFIFLGVRCIYNPREHAGIGRAFSDWLREHPEWEV